MAQPSMGVATPRDNFLGGANGTLLSRISIYAVAKDGSALMLARQL